MAAQNRDMDQVRQIMHKLDRSLSDARDRRLNKDTPEPIPAPAPPQVGVSQQPGSGRFGAPRLGKAKPLHRREGDGSDRFRD